MITIKCTGCHKHLPLDAFSKDSKRPHGKSAQCRVCRSIWHQQHKRARASMERARIGHPLNPDSKFHITAAEKEMRILRWADVGKFEIECLKCHHRFQRSLRSMSKPQTKCPGCRPQGRHMYYPPERASKRLLEYGVILDEDTYKSFKHKALVRCIYCTRDFWVSPTELCRANKYYQCECRRKPRPKKRTTQERVEHLRGLGLEVLDIDKYQPNRKMKFRCMKCGYEFLAVMDLVIFRKNKCLSKQCCTDDARYVKVSTSVQKRIKEKPLADLTEAEELRRIDEGIAKMNKSWDGKYFWERDSVEQFDLLENIRKVMAEQRCG